MNDYQKASLIVEEKKELRSEMIAYEKLLVRIAFILTTIIITGIGASLHILNTTPLPSNKDLFRESLIYSL